MSHIFCNFKKWNKIKSKKITHPLTETLPNIIIINAPNRTTRKLHLILSQSPSLIAKYVLNKCQFVIQIWGFCLHPSGSILHIQLHLIVWVHEKYLNNSHLQIAKARGEEKIIVRSMDAIFWRICLEIRF